MVDVLSVVRKVTGTWIIGKAFLETMFVLFGLVWFGLVFHEKTHRKDFSLLEYAEGVEKAAGLLN